MKIEQVIQVWIKENGPYMYHAARPELSEAICQAGLLPASALGHTGNYTEEIGLAYLQSRLDNVYLSAHHDKLYSGPERNLVQPYLEIDVRELDPQMWCIDEDHKGDMDTNHLPAWKVDDESKGSWAERHTQDLDTPENISISLDKGSVSYRGGISADAISLNPQMAHVHGWALEIEQMESVCKAALADRDMDEWQKAQARISYMRRVIGTPAIISGDVRKQFMVNDQMRQAAHNRDLARWEKYDPEGTMTGYLERKYNLDDTQHRSVKSELVRHQEDGQWHENPRQSFDEYQLGYIAPEMPEPNKLSL